MANISAALLKKGRKNILTERNTSINLPERAELGDLGFPLKLKKLSKIFLPPRCECRMKMFSTLFYCKYKANLSRDL